MGGIIRKEITSTVTHVVAHSVFGLKYKVRTHTYVLYTDVCVLCYVCVYMCVCVCVLCLCVCVCVCAFGAAMKVVFFLGCSWDGHTYHG